MLCNGLLTQCQYDLYCPATHRTRKKIDGLLQQFSALEEEFLKSKKPRIAVLVVSCNTVCVHTCVRACVCVHACV